MFSTFKTRPAAIAACVALAVTTAGGAATSIASTQQDSASPRLAVQAPRPAAVPKSIRAVESAAEDTIDFVLAGKRTKAVAAARTLDRVARGQAATDLAAGGVAQARIAKFQARAAGVDMLAASGTPIEVALASNRAFDMISRFFALYRDPVPAEVIRLDYLDFEAKLQAIAGNRHAATDAVRDLDAVWTALQPQVFAAGGQNAAKSFDQHVRAIRVLVRTGTDRQVAKEAQHGLDLVDRIEAVYVG